MVPLTSRQADALAAIQDAFPDADVVLIGALALGHHISMEHRHTDDLDRSRDPARSLSGAIE